MTTEAEVFEVRWEGTTDLDREAMDAGHLDGLVFAVVAYRVHESGATRFIKGHTRRKDVYRVEEFRVLTGDKRSQAVEFLTGRVDDEGEQLSFDIPAVQIDGNSVASLSVLGVDDEVDVTEFDDSAEEVLGNVRDYKEEPDRIESNGPRVAKFKPEDSEEIAGVTDREVVGSIYGPEYKRKDKALHKFLTQEN